MILERGNRFVARIYLGNRQYAWLGTFGTRAEAERIEQAHLSGRNSICEVCGASPADIHHINRDRDDNSRANLIVLCRSHHHRAHSGRLIWDALAQIDRASSLEEAKGIAAAALRGTVPEKRFGEPDV